MAIKSSGSLAMSEIVAEFGGDAPHAFSEYYGGGDRVPAGANSGIATSGQIRFNSFFNGVAATVFSVTSNANNLNIKTLAASAGGDQNTPVIMTIASGVTIGSSSNGTPALITDTGWGSGTTITIINNGSIVGANGAAGSAGSNANANPSSGGGSGGNYVSYQNGTAGGAGGAGSGSAGSGQNGANGTAGGIAFQHTQTADDNLAVVFSTAGTRTGGTGGAGGAYGTLTTLGNGGGGGGGGAGGSNGCIGGNGGGGAASGSGGTGAGNNGSNGGATSGGGGGGVVSTKNCQIGNVCGTAYNCGSGYPEGWIGFGSAGGGGAGGNINANGSAGGGGYNRSGGAGGAAGSSGTANGSAGSAGADGAALSGNTSQIS